MLYLNIKQCRGQKDETLGYHASGEEIIRAAGHNLGD